MFNIFVFTNYIVYIKFSQFHSHLAKMIKILWDAFNLSSSSQKSTQVQVPVSISVPAPESAPMPMPVPTPELVSVPEIEPELERVKLEISNSEVLPKFVTNEEINEVICPLLFCLLLTHRSKFF